MIAKCIRRCWDGKRARRYFPGDQDDIDLLNPVAKYFDIPKELIEQAKVGQQETTGQEAPEKMQAADTGPTKKQIMERLQGLGIEYKESMNKTELLALLPKE
jgi:hypothetical protein